MSAVFFLPIITLIQRWSVAKDLHLFRVLKQLWPNCTHRSSGYFYTTRPTTVLAFYSLWIRYLHLGRNSQCYIYFCLSTKDDISTARPLSQICQQGLCSWLSSPIEVRNYVAVTLCTFLSFSGCDTKENMQTVEYLRPRIRTCYRCRCRIRRLWARSLTMQRNASQRKTGPMFLPEANFWQKSHWW